MLTRELVRYIVQPELVGPFERTAWAGRCYVCHSEFGAIRHSAHWKRLLCLECMEGTAAEPVGFVCEERLPSGALCLAPAPARWRCPEHPLRGRRSRRARPD